MREGGDTQSLARSWRAPGSLTFTACPAGALAHLRQAFDKPAGGDGVTSDPFVALAHRIAQAQLQRINAELVGKFVDLRFTRKRDLWIAKAAKAGGPQLVGVKDLSAGMIVRRSEERRVGKEG